MLSLLQWARSQYPIRLNPEKIDLTCETLGQICVLHEIAAKKNITINNTIPENTTIYADKQTLTTVIRNLVSNAIKFT